MRPIRFIVLCLINNTESEFCIPRRNAFIFNHITRNTYMYLEYTSVIHKGVHSDCVVTRKAVFQRKSLTPLTMFAPMYNRQHVVIIGCSVGL